MRIILSTCVLDFYRKHNEWNIKKGILKEGYYERLTHIILEAEKFNDLPYAGWSPRKASAI